MKEKIIGILYAKTKRAEMLDSGHYAEVIEEDDFEVIAESIVKLCNLHGVSQQSEPLPDDWGHGDVQLPNDYVRTSSTKIIKGNGG